MEYDRTDNFRHETLNETLNGRMNSQRNPEGMNYQLGGIDFYFLSNGMEYDRTDNFLLIINSMKIQI